jgi:hypothetical protein
MLSGLRRGEVFAPRWRDLREQGRLWLLRTPYALGRLRLRVFFDSLQCVLRPPLSAPLAPVHGPLTRLAAPRDHRAPTPAGRRASIETPASSPHGDRPGVVGLAFAGVEWLALGRLHRQAGNRHRMAPARLSPVLEVEESTAQREARCATRRSRPDPRAIHRESASMRTAVVKSARCFRYSMASLPTLEQAPPNESPHGRPSQRSSCQRRPLLNSSRSPVQP